MRLSFICFALVLVWAGARAQPAARAAQFNLSKGIAINGYDPVSYFDGKPLPGRPDQEYEYQGVRYRFSSAQNLARFKKDPNTYEPAYGGWCAYAMGDSGEKVKIDPATYKILNGKLYLFYNFWGSNTLQDWNKAEQQLKQAADRNWKKFVQ
ncbi:YHS domain-containing (seleno)protein [Oscillatoria amoena NRMC-F 0135]|jgi:YHS domain-containing protein|nr:YHS domain-containing (seleno)protein [Oscillatoria amoena NRMC-F 0135]